MDHQCGDLLSIPGYWYVFVSLPLFQFVLLRWYYRIALWYRFLWKVSKLSLNLNSLHPDRSGGLGFLCFSVYAFEPMLLAHSFLLAGLILNKIVNTGATLFEFQYEMVGMAILLILLPLAPLIFFIRSLAKTKRLGTLEYDVVASKYVQDCRKKWIDTESNTKDDILGSSDFQSLADLGNSYSFSTQMRAIPVDRNCLLYLVVLTFLPFFPLIFTVIPLESFIKRAISIVF